MSFNDIFTLRALLAIALVLSNWAISSPPNAPPGPTERSMTKAGREFIFITIAGPIVTVVQAILYVGALCELLAPAALHHHSVLSDMLLFAPADAIRLRLTFFCGFGGAIGIFGCFLRFKSFQALGNLFTYQLAIRKNHTLITTGPYQYIRHPAYTGSIIAAIGTAMFFLGEGSYARECGALTTYAGILCTAIWASWKVFMVLNVAQRTMVEDEFLKAEFGDAWNAWAEVVKYKLVPGVY
ncbi:ICMT-domain-containing protein [Mycena metata]|uniref:Protein-S-isoprenylcysteine O-methyltransferase n=1 Tax=Mycena metata TaxID=1033252 RepID=A0AAD7NKJ4_9AGAR|nr:ICMT-domain-containing protein [Mycena metata]